MNLNTTTANIHSQNQFTMQSWQQWSSAYEPIGEETRYYQEYYGHSNPYYLENIRGIFLRVPGLIENLKPGRYLVRDCPKYISNHLEWLKSRTDCHFYLPRPFEKTVQASHFSFYEIIRHNHETAKISNVLLLLNIDGADFDYQYVSQRFSDFKDHLSQKNILGKAEIMFSLKLALSSKFNYNLTFAQTAELLKKYFPNENLKIHNPFFAYRFQHLGSKLMMHEIAHNTVCYDSWLYHFYLSSGASCPDIATEIPSYGHYQPLSRFHGLWLTSV
jgi:hypothetical protein